MFQSTKSNFNNARSEKEFHFHIGGSYSFHIAISYRGLMGAEPPEMVALFVCPLKTNAGVY